MKVIILNEYDDKQLERRVKVGEVLDLDNDRIETLKSKGVHTKEYEEDLGDEDIDLVKAFKVDRNIVDGLNAKDLKILCEEFEINYTNVADAKEALKIVTFG